MTNNQTPQEQAARAVADFDQAVNDPARRYDAVGSLFAGLAAAAAQHAQERRAARTCWRNRPEVKARRSAAAKKAAATRSERKAREEALAQAECERDARMPAVHCPHIDFVRDAIETECAGEPGHDDDHEDIDGHTWPNECDEDCGEICGY
ncbi:hypothetical protein ACFVH9_08585 [Streptomyces hirsutus]|uniref:hypothetical protein n=1 Tax=Streptomyces hirsutus TaxID=35620 RepID=UPI0036434EDB